MSSTLVIKGYFYHRYLVSKNDVIVYDVDAHACILMAFAFIQGNVLPINTMILKVLKKI